MPQESAAAQPQKSTFLGFVIRAAVVTAIIALGIVYVIDSVVETASEYVDTGAVKTKLRRIFQDEKTKVRLKGLFTSNPAVHYRVSLIDEREGRLASAIEEIELAIGLLELHSSDKAVRERYTTRLQELRRKQAAAEAGQAPAGKK